MEINASALSSREMNSIHRRSAEIEGGNRRLVSVRGPTVMHQNQKGLSI
jgi:hypothetical protein